MIKDLISITEEEISESAAKSVESNSGVIMYLHNNGSEEHRWNNDDINRWIYEDIDE